MLSLVSKTTPGPYETRQMVPLGQEVTLSPKRPFSLNPFARNPTFEDLVVRVDRARAKRPG